MPRVATIDFHVTSECNQECPYCWGPQGFEHAVDTATARAILRKIAEVGARRVVFTGGDPLLRPDIGPLIRYAKEWVGLEVALSTTGDELSREFLEQVHPFLDLISLPLDGASEEVSSRTKNEGHLQAILQDLEVLADFPDIDVKVATPVTRHNLQEVPAIVRLLDEHAARMPNRFFYNVFQAFPRSMQEVRWEELVVGDDEFQALRIWVEGTAHAFPINWLSHQTLDRLYVMILPDGTLAVPSGSRYVTFGPFLEVSDLEAVLEHGDFDLPKHLQHARGWSKPAE